MKSHRSIHFPAFAVFALLLLTGCGGTTADVTPVPAAIPSDAGGVILAEGRIVPRDYTNLYVAAPGKVEEILVAEGETVSKGAVLLRLGDRDAHQAGVAAAQSEVLSAEQALDQLKRTADMAYHQALLEEAAAQKAYNAARKAWNAFDQDQYEKDLDKAKSDVATAFSELEDAQKEFDKYSDREKDNPDRARTKQALEDAQTKYDNAVIRQTEIENRFIQVNSNLEVARGRLEEAARIRRLRENGPDADQLALAESALTAARARLAAAQTELEKLDVVAPYAGTIARIDISSGENALPSLPVIVFADFSRWYVETTDFTEKEIPNIKVGQLVTIVPDSLPGISLTGTIERIGLTFAEKAGDVVYPVRIRLDPSDAALYWGMTVEVRTEE